MRSSAQINTLFHQWNNQVIKPSFNLIDSARTMKPGINRGITACPHHSIWLRPIRPVSGCQIIGSESTGHLFPSFPNANRHWRMQAMGGYQSISLHWTPWDHFISNGYAVVQTLRLMNSLSTYAARQRSVAVPSSCVNQCWALFTNRTLSHTQQPYGICCWSCPRPTAL